jgi:hypothetical protein
MGIAPQISSKPAAGRFLSRLCLKLTGIVMALLIVLFVHIPGQIREYVYNIFCEAGRAHALLGTRHMHTLSGGRFVVRYEPADAGGARLVLKAAQRFYPQIARDFHFTTGDPILLVVYPSRESLNASFGWPASESAMGVYWAGVIRVLSPRAWIDARDPREVEEIFLSSGPVAHELTHLVVDYLTRGNVPRWLTEGIAQYEEYKLTGFRFAQIQDLTGFELYDFKVMDRKFDELPDQTLAYGQSLAAVEYLVEEYGVESLHRILTVLGQGRDINEALEKVTGRDVDGFASGFKLWIEQKV